MFKNQLFLNRIAQNNGISKLNKPTTKFSFNGDAIFIYFYLNRIHQDLQANSFIGLTLKGHVQHPILLE